MKNKESIELINSKFLRNLSISRALVITISFFLFLAAKPFNPAFAARSINADLAFPNLELYNVHIVEDDDFLDYRFLAFGKQYVYYVDVEKQQLEQLCAFSHDTWAPLEDHQKHINHLIRKVQYHEGFLYYMLAGKILALDFQTCIGSKGNKVASSKFFPETSKKKFINSLFAGLTGFICDFEFYGQYVHVLECDGKLSIYQKTGENSYTPSYKLEVSKAFIDPSSQGKSSFTLQYLEPSIFLAKIHGRFYVYGKFSEENAMYPNFKLIEYHTETLSILGKTELDCENTDGSPLDFFEVNGETRFLFSDKYSVSLIANKNGRCVDYGVRNFYSKMGVIGNISPYHQSSKFGYVFDGQLHDLTKETTLSLNINETYTKNCRLSPKGIDLVIERGFFAETMEGIFLCDGRFTDSLTTLHIRQGIKQSR